MYQIKAFYPNFFRDKKIAYVILRILSQFRSKEVSSSVMGLSSDNSVLQFKKDGFYQDAFPRFLIWPLVQRLLKQKQRHAIADFLFLKTLKEGDIAYLWPGSSLKLYQKIKKKGCIIVSERINTLTQSSKLILDSEYDRLGVPHDYQIDEYTIQEEILMMTLSDYIFSPSEAVTRSLIEAGIDRDSVLETSYGLREEELFPKPINQNKDHAKYLFAGHICVRKGVHLLIDAWKKANVNGTLTIIGTIKPYFVDLIRNEIESNVTIKHVNFVDDLIPYYEDADVFILPSLEEGSPLVTYLALGAGLPMITSRMGAGSVVHDGQEGIIVDPHDIEGVAQAIRTIHSDFELRKKMSENAHRSAGQYIWDNVAKKRVELLLANIEKGK